VLRRLSVRTAIERGLRSVVARARSRPAPAGDNRAHARDARENSRGSACSATRQRQRRNATDPEIKPSSRASARSPPGSTRSRRDVASLSSRSDGQIKTVSSGASALSLSLSPSLIFFSLLSPLPSPLLTRLSVNIFRRRFVGRRARTRHVSEALSLLRRASAPPGECPPLRSPSRPPPPPPRRCSRCPSHGDDLSSTRSRRHLASESTYGAFAKGITIVTLFMLTMIGRDRPRR